VNEKNKSAQTAGTQAVTRRQFIAGTLASTVSAAMTSPSLRAADAPTATEPERKIKLGGEMKNPFFAMYTAVRDLALLAHRLLCRRDRLRTAQSDRQHEAGKLSFHPVSALDEDEG
jgi:hypothetical protein